MKLPWTTCCIQTNLKQKGALGNPQILPTEGESLLTNIFPPHDPVSLAVHVHSCPARTARKNRLKEICTYPSQGLTKLEDTFLTITRIALIPV